MNENVVRDSLKSRLFSHFYTIFSDTYILVFENYYELKERSTPNRHHNLNPLY